MRTRDIPDRAFLDVVLRFNLGLYVPTHDWERDGGPRWCYAWDIEERKGWPIKVVWAKGRSLIRRGLLEGCTTMHNCRHDYEIPGIPSFFGASPTREEIADSGWWVSGPVPAKEDIF